MGWTKVGAYTHSYKKNNRGKWKRRKGSISVRLEVTFRNDECVDPVSKSKNMHKPNAKRARVSVSRYGNWGSETERFDYANGEVYSVHSGEGINYFTLRLDPC